MTARTPILARVTVLGVLLCFSTSVAFAQQQPSPDSPLIVGTRVRVTAPSIESRVPGVIENIDGDVLTLRADGGGVMKLSMASVSRVDVSLGRKRNVLQGLAAGGLAGMLISFAMPVNPDECDSDDSNFCSRGEAMVGAMIPFAGIGALVGTFIKRERWTRVTIAPAAAVRDGSARLRVTVGF